MSDGMGMALPPYTVTLALGDICSSGGEVKNAGVCVQPGFDNKSLKMYKVSG